MKIEILKTVVAIVNAAVCSLQSAVFTENVQHVNANDCYVEENTLLQPDYDFENLNLNDFDYVQIIDFGSDPELLENRDGKIIIEKAIGVVLDEEGNGELLNCNSCSNCYIKYGKSDENIGDIVLTYFIYNPDSDYYDDIMLRYDYVIGNLE